MIKLHRRDPVLSRAISGLAQRKSGFYGFLDELSYPFDGYDKRNSNVKVIFRTLLRWQVMA